MHGTNDTGTIVRYAALHAIAAASYIFLIASIVTNVPNFEKTVPAFVAASTFLLLFVTSAAVMGLLVFARPVLWFMNGEKIAAVRLAIMTVLALAFVAAIFLLIAISM